MGEDRGHLDTRVLYTEYTYMYTDTRVLYTEYTYTEYTYTEYTYTEYTYTCHKGPVYAWVAPLSNVNSLPDMYTQCMHCTVYTKYTHICLHALL